MNRSEGSRESAAEPRLDRLDLEMDTQASDHYESGQFRADCRDIGSGISPDLADVPVSDQELLPIVQAAILPGLHLKYGPTLAPAEAVETAGPSLDPGVLSKFVDSLVESDLEAAWACVERMRGHGATAEWVVLELFSSAAVMLGERWDEDENSFAEVTIAMSHLSAFLRRNSEEFLASGRHHRMDCRILMTPAPGEQHTFGLGIASEYFLRAGFEVYTQGDSSLQSLVDYVRDQAFDAVGLSLGSIKHKDALANAIRRLRRASRQRALAIVVGGPLFGFYPDLYREVGADLMITDIREGPVRVMKLVKMLARRHGAR